MIHKWSKIRTSLREKCLNTEFFLLRIFLYSYFPVLGLTKFPYSAQIQENTDQKKLRIWTFFTQCGFAFRLSVKGLQLPKYNKDNRNPIFLDFTSFLENYFLRHVRNTFLKFIACILFALFANFIKKCFSMILTVRFMISE